MSVQSSQIPTLSADDLPKDVRSWLERGVLGPLNRVLDLLRALLNRGISLRAHVNAQVVERKFIPPSSDPDFTNQLDWSASKLDTPSTLSGACLGVQVLGAWTIDGAGRDVASVSGLPAPSWREVVVDGGRQIRLIYQPGLTSGVRYRLVLLAWGG